MCMGVCTDMRTDMCTDMCIGCIQPCTREATAGASSMFYSFVIVVYFTHYCQQEFTRYGWQYFNDILVNTSESRIFVVPSYI